MANITFLSSTPTRIEMIVILIERDLDFAVLAGFGPVLTAELVGFPFFFFELKLAVLALGSFMGFHVFFFFVLIIELLAKRALDAVPLAVGQMKVCSLFVDHF